MDTQASGTFSCYLIGTESLLIQCAEALLSRGHRVLGVLSADPQIGAFAEAQDIPIIDPKSDLALVLGATPFDYLFSIANLSIIPGPILRLPRRAAINFHDGPLPHYGGLYATSWALVHGERQHGISWHLMLTDVDAGDLLCQRTFDVAEGETALTLNAKCYEAGMDSFGELIEALAAGRDDRRPQGPVKDKERAYFGRYRRPAAGAVLDFQRPAAELAALVRALDFGPYPNPLCCAKLLLAEGPVLVSQAQAAEVSEPMHDSPPGTILSIDRSADKALLRVAAGRGELRITALRTLDGQPLSIEALAEERSLKSGDRLPLLTSAAAARLGALHESLAKSEAFFVRRLSQPAPLLPPDVQPRTGAAADWLVLPFEVPKALSALALRTEIPAGELLLGAAAACLGRLCDRTSFDLAYRDAMMVQAIEGGEGCFAGQVPMRVVMAEGADFVAFMRAFSGELSELRSRTTYALDTVARQPAVAAALAKAGPLCVVLDLANDQAGQASALPTGCALAIRVQKGGEHAALFIDRAAFADGGAGAQELPRRIGALLSAAAADPNQPLQSLSLLDEAERRRLLVEWNDTARPVPAERGVHRAFEAQVRRTPDRIALVFEDRELTYAAVNARSNQLARQLQASGVGADTLVGICVERSIEMMIAVLAVHKAGGAYVPLDPAYPKERLAFMMEDAGLGALLTQAHLLALLPPWRCPRLCVDPSGPDAEAAARQPTEDLDKGGDSGALCYVIYTSGSTGKPKGVMVEHRNVLNFFAGMDEHVPHDPPGVWLAVTSLSFDISVLELYYTLCRGFKVVIQRDTSQELSPAARRKEPGRALDFSLFYFASDEGGAGALEKYQLLLDGARFADRHGFSAVWTPERHFYAFGGLYPNPAVISAALASITERVRIRAGSCVLPLHDPIRVAEEWAVVDNLSRGRVDISFAAGWQPNDFVLAPKNFADRKRIMMEAIETVRRLWRGESIRRPGHDGKEVELRTLPRPVQKELPVWLTAAGNPETFQLAGEIGAGVLTHLLGQTFDEVREKCAIYRKAFRDGGHPGRGHVTLMLHTFVGPDLAEVKRLVRAPMRSYLKSAVALIKEAAWTFPTFQKRAEGSGRTPGQLLDDKDLSAEDMDALLDHALDRYFDRAGLFGTPESCLATIDQARDADADEIGCLIDYGVAAETVLSHLPYLAELKDRACPVARVTAQAAVDYSIAAQLARHGVTHLQCTPSMMSMIMLDDAARAAVSDLQVLLLGGEALPRTLLSALSGVVRGPILNVYGPTETTIWSTAGRVDPTAEVAPIGRPLCNTEIYLLDQQREPVPIGAIGELYIGGAGVVRGYLGRPELTAERFVQDPFAASPKDSRLYRTGDLARYLPDGRVLFLGRADHQVKIRGHRIELGEIEAKLADHGDLKEVVVVARDDGGGPMLCAYVTAKAGRVLDGKALREGLARSLPTYMVPAHLIVLSAMPLTPNAKIDRQALPPPAEARPALAAPSAPPSSDIERQIATIWQEVLGLPKDRPVGLDDNFFDLGGHSLLTVQAHRRLKAETGRDLSITDMFRFSTIRALASFLGGDRSGADEGLKQSESRADARREAMARRKQLQQRRQREGEP